jgi:hypothetical protein
MLQATLQETLARVSNTGVDDTCVHMIRECLRLAQLQSNLHISLLPADVHAVIALQVCGHLSARTLCKHHSRLRTFCSYDTLQMLWDSVQRIPKSVFNTIYADTVRAVHNTASSARRALSREDDRSDFMILLQPVERAEHAVSLDGILTDEGRVVAWIESNAPNTLPVDDAIDLTVEASAHRCIMKRDAKRRFGTYAPYMRQDFISIYCPYKRVTWVIDAQPICASFVNFGYLLSCRH